MTKRSRAAARRKLPAEAVELYNLFIHGEISRRDFMDGVRHLDEKPAQSRAVGATVLRTYGIGAQILKDLGVTRMRVLSAPKQLQGLAAFDLEVTEYINGGE